MDLTITIGWWLVPLVATAVACACAYWQSRPNGRPTLGDGIVSLIMWGGAVILSLLAWLIWAVLT
jgi:hypothetical protein